jgi:O-methyltransferase
MKIRHPHGNLKIAFIKAIASFFSRLVLLILKFFLDIDTKTNEIIISRATYAPWKIDNKFLKIYSKLKLLTLLDEKRFFTIYTILQQLKNINADILDLGCMRGGVGMMMSKINLNGNTYLIDTFSGFKEEEKYHKKDIFVFTSISEIEKNIKKLNLKKIYILKQKFPNTSKLKNIKKLKLCHIDVNTYRSTKKSYNYVKKKLIKGGIIIFDDYGIFGVEQVTKFVNEIKLRDKKHFYFISNYMGQCILIKK